jgi:hypothetical protein
VSAAVALRAEAEATGVRLRLAPGGKVRAAGAAPPELLARLRAHKAELAELLAGRVCRHCGEVMDWPVPVGRMFADGTGAHHACRERAEVERIRARAANALSAETLADEAELTIRGELS